MLKFVNPRHPDLVFVVPDGAAAARYEAWDGGHPEAALIGWAKHQFADPNGAFVDIGANCGLWTLHMCDAFRHVYAFEPNLDTFSRCAASVALSNVQRENISLFNVALGARDGSATLRAVGTDAFDASFVQYGSDVAGVDVPVRRLSDVLHDMKIALVKIDVEGYEYEVLQGAEQFLRAASLPPILFESWVAQRGQHPFDDTRALLEGYGYEINNVSWPEEYLAVRKRTDA